MYEKNTLYEDLSCLSQTKWVIYCLLQFLPMLKQSGNQYIKKILGVLNLEFWIHSIDIVYLGIVGLANI